MTRALGALVAGGEVLAGTVLTLPGATAAELLSEPFDLVWIDLEHAALGRDEAQEMIIGAQAAGTYALVRVRPCDHALVGAMLDAGADGVVLADVPDASTALAAARAAAHPPLGSRGYGPRRAAWRRRTRVGTATGPSLWAQIERAGAVERAAEIAAVPGIDALVVGTADLSFSLGVPLDLGAPALQRAARTVHRSCAAAGVAFGLAGPLDTAPRALLRSASLLVHGTDARLCAAAVDGAAAWLRAKEAA